MQPEIEEVSEESKSSASTHSVHSSRVEIKSEEFQDHMVKHAKTLAEDELEQLLPIPKKKPPADNELQVPGQTQPDGISCFASEQQINDDLIDEDGDASAPVNMNGTTDKRVDEEDQ